MDLPKLAYDRHLKPHNAHERGYVLVGDIRIDYHLPQPIPEDIIFLIQSGFKLGQPTCIAEAPEFLGLYRPVYVT